MTNKVFSKVRLASEKGFSLIELMVVVTIIGILAGIAVPKFQSFRARANQTEAKSGLNGIFLSMQAYQANYNEYPKSKNEDASTAGIGFALGGNKTSYLFHLSTDANGIAFAASGYSKLKVSDAYDSLRINTNKWLCQPFDAVANKAATASTGKSAINATDCPEQGVAGTQFKAAVKSSAGTGHDDPI